MRCVAEGGRRYVTGFNVLIVITTRAVCQTISCLSKIVIKIQNCVIYLFFIADIDVGRWKAVSNTWGRRDVYNITFPIPCRRLGFSRDKDFRFSFTEVVEETQRTSTSAPCIRTTYATKNDVRMFSLLYYLYSAVESLLSAMADHNERMAVGELSSETAYDKIANIRSINDVDVRIKWTNQL